MTTEQIPKTLVPLGADDVRKVGLDTSPQQHTAYIRENAGVKARLDWSKPEKVLGNATRIVEYRRQGRIEYKAVQVLGMTGQLSILKPGKFAIVINWAPEIGLPGFQTDPTHRLREIAENPTVDSYDKAVAALTDPKEEISADAFFTVAGTEPDQMCVIERKGSSSKFHPRPPPDGQTTLVQSNHYDPRGKFASHNLPDLVEALPQDEDGYGMSASRSSKVRQKMMETTLAALGNPTGLFAKLHACMNGVPVLNGETQQQMVFHVASGEIVAWHET